MKPPHEIVFLFDADNTLVDSDRVRDDLRNHIGLFGAASADRYCTIFEALRAGLGYAEYPGALQRYRREEEGGLLNDSRPLRGVAAATRTK